MTSFFNTAVAAAVAIGIAFPPSAASADGEDIAKVLAGVATLAIIAKAADDRKDRREREAKARTERIGRFGSSDGRRVIDGQIRPYGSDEHRRAENFKKLALPRQCLRTVETRYGSRPAYASQCLDRNYRYARRLPESCETLIRTPRGLRAVYGARCLKRDGWKVVSR